MKEKLFALFRHHPRLAVAASAFLVGILVFAAFGVVRGSDVQYFTAEVQHGDIIPVVQATGTIEALTTVEVGSQVTGRIAELHVDFNSRVRKGQVIAQIDPFPFRARLTQAEADLENAKAGIKSLEADLAAAQANIDKARAARREAELNLQRVTGLFQQGIASVQERDSVQIAYDTAVANLEVAEAQLMQTQARLEQGRAQVAQRQAAVEMVRLDLDHTVIRAPIDGTVIARGDLEREINVGQTVAASLQAPTLFIIAQDLTKMLVKAKTDESDVGKIRVDARASFKVDSFPKETFHGRVKQVRMNAYQVQNVVTYDTIIEFDNPELKLLPGMTAYVTIPIANARDVIKIPNGALRYKPDIPEEELRALREKLGPPPEERAGRDPREGSAGRRTPGMGLRAQGGGPPGGESVPRLRYDPTVEREGEWQVVWGLEGKNSLRPVYVKVGLTDYTYTAMLAGDLKAGDKLIIGQSTAGTTQGTQRSFRGMMRRF